MTEEELVNKILEDFKDDKIEEFACWHLKEIKKAELRARIDENIKLSSGLNATWRLIELQSELRKMEEANG